jgi:hypothetical protein
VLIGRKQELARLREAILSRQSLLVHGAAGAGKTALLAEALSGMPPRIRRSCLLCTVSESPRAMWRSLTRSLAAAGDPQVTMRVQGECAEKPSVDCWLAKQSSLRLRGVLGRATRENAYWVFLDPPGRLPDGVYNLLKDWVWSRSMPVTLLGRGCTESVLGKAARLFWHNGMRLELLPMRGAEVEALLEDSIARLELSKIADDDFRGFALRCAAGMPGRIVRLCELARKNVYQWRGHVKLHTLEVDFLMQENDGRRRWQQEKQNA